jgi:hypothetical protein
MKPSNIYEALAVAQGTVLKLIDAGCEVLSVGVDMFTGGMKPRVLVMRNNELDQLVMDNHVAVVETPAALTGKPTRMASIEMAGCRVSWVV